VLQISIPITEFLDRALVASSRTAIPSEATLEYAAMAVLAARAADAGALHDKLIQDWRSIDDVTGDSIMVLAPQPPDERPMWIKAPKEPKALQSSGLGGSHLGQSSDWSKRFWNAYPVVEPDAAAFWRAPEPVDERQARAGFTSSASEIARYFRLEEADLPCLAIVSFWDRNLLIIGPGALAAHGPYELFRRFVQAYGPPPRWRRIHAEQEEMRLTQARLERELRRSQAASIDGSHNWCAQRDAVLKALAALAPQLDADLRADAARIDALLRKGDAPADGDMAAAARLLHKAGKESRLGHKLPRALAKLPVVPKDPTVAMRNADRAAELRREIVSAQPSWTPWSASALRQPCCGREQRWVWLSASDHRGGPDGRRCFSTSLSLMARRDCIALLTIGPSTAERALNNERSSCARSATSCSKSDGSWRCILRSSCDLLRTSRCISRVASRASTRTGSSQLSRPARQTTKRQAQPSVQS